MRYLLLMGSVQRLIYFRLYPHTTFGLYPSQIAFVMLAIGMFVLISRFGVLTERRPLPWMVVMFVPEVLCRFLAAVFIDGDKLWDAIQDAGTNILGMTIVSSVFAFPIRWWQRRRRRLAPTSATTEAEGPVWPPPPQS